MSKNSSLPITIGGFITASLSLGLYLTSSNDGVKNLSLALGIMGATAATISTISTRMTETELRIESDGIIENKNVEFRKLETKLTNQTAKLTEVFQEISELMILVNEKEKLIAELQRKFSVMSLKYVKKHQELDDKLGQENTIIEDLHNNFIEVFTSDLRYRIDYQYERINRQVDHKLESENYTDIHAVMQQFKAQLNARNLEHITKLLDTSNIEHDSEFATNLSDIYFQISDEITALKVRYRNLLNTTVQRDLIAAQEELEFRRDPKSFVSTDKAIEATKMQEEMARQNVDTIRQVALNNNASLNDLRDEVTDLIDQIEEKNLEILKLKDEINIHRMPLKWTLAQSNELKIGNLIIDYFWKDGTGYYLDRSFHETDGYECKLYFQIDRNPRQIVEKELNEHSEALQQYCRVIKPIEFSYSGSKGLMVAKVTLKEKPKIETSRDEISRICKPHEHFKATVSVYERWRVTGGSQAGKSPMAQMIADAITESIKIYQSKPVKVRLFNPQADSRKDNWKYKAEGKNGEECLKGYGTFASELRARQGGKVSKDTFQLFIFDEIDSVIAEFKGAKVKNNIEYGIKQGSHQDVGAIIIGQSSAANIIPGFTWSDWNNVAQCHIGENAKNFIETRYKNDSEAMSDYLGQFKKIKAYFQKKNDENGLKISDYGYYRFAFVAIPNQQPTFVELPPFLFSLKQEQDSELSNYTQPILLTNNIEPLLVEDKKEIKCPHCSSTNIVKNGKNKITKAQLYSCKDCDGSPKKWSIGISEIELGF